MVSPTSAPTSASTSAPTADLHLAKKSAIEEAFHNLRPNLISGRWLTENNRYRETTIASIDEDVRTNTIKEKDLVEYIAASVPLHAVDGWAYLGRAIHAQLLGDGPIARHLSYYAELRAAMSLLAAHGIGVFNRKHFVVTEHDKVQMVEPLSMTHAFVWDALKWWASQPGSSEWLGNLVRPYGRRLDAWLSGAPGYAEWQPVAQNLILSFGLDLQHKAMEDDRNSRNSASYRPTRIVSTSQVDEHANAMFAIELWSSLEPAGAGFEWIDKHFFRSALELAFKAVARDSETSGEQTYSTVVKSVLNAMNLDDTEKERIGQFLRRECEPNDLSLLSNARMNSDNNGVQSHLSMMSRATLLLVLASAATRSLMGVADIKLDEAQFWWGPLGLDRGMWSSAPQTDELKDKWADILLQISELQTWSGKGVRSCGSLVSDCPGSFAWLSQLEFAALWGLVA